MRFKTDDHRVTLLLLDYLMTMIIVPAGSHAVSTLVRIFMLSTIMLKQINMYSAQVIK